MPSKLGKHNVLKANPVTWTAVLIDYVYVRRDATSFVAMFFVFLICCSTCIHNIIGQ